MPSTSELRHAQSTCTALVIRDAATSELSHAQSTCTALVLRDAADGIGCKRQRKPTAVFNPDLDGLSDRQKLQRLQGEADRKQAEPSKGTKRSVAACSKAADALGQQVKHRPVVRTTTANRADTSIGADQGSEQKHLTLAGIVEETAWSGDTKWANDLEARALLYCVRCRSRM